MALKIRINRKSVESMTRQLTDQLGDLISTGALAIGSLLPSERTLANSLGVARNVVRGSYEYLEKAGIVQREGRKGRRVRAKTSRRKLRRVRPLRRRRLSDSGCDYFVRETTRLFVRLPRIADLALADDRASDTFLVSTPSESAFRFHWCAQTRGAQTN